MAPEVGLLSFSLNFPRAEKKKNKGSGGHFFTFPKRKKERKVETESLFVAALPSIYFFPPKRIGKVKKWNKVIVIERKKTFDQLSVWRSELTGASHKNLSSKVRLVIQH